MNKKPTHKIIYLIVNKINGKSYVGQTMDTIIKRFTGHCKTSKCRETKMSRAIKKYGSDQFYIDQIDICYSDIEANMKEVYWIAKLNTITPSGYNMTIGGGYANISRLHKKYYSSEDIQYLKLNFGKLSMQEMADNLNKSYGAVRNKCVALGLRYMSNSKHNNYLTNREFINKLKSEIPYLTEQIIYPFFAKGLIKTYHEKNRNYFLEESEYIKWFKFFQEYIPVSQARLLLPDRYKNTFEHWCKEGKNILKVFRIENKRQWSIWIEKESINKVLNIFNNYLTMKEMSDYTGYTTQYIQRLVTQKRVKSMIFLRTNFFHKSEAESLKARNELYKKSKIYA